MFLHKKSGTLFSAATSQSSTSALPSLMESPHTSSPISPHNALLSVCPLVMAVPRYNGSPPYLTHSYANIRFHPNIWWQEFLSLSPFSPDYAAICRLARPGIDYSRIIMISHISCSQRCKTHNCLVFYCRHACFHLCARYTDGQSQTDRKNSFMPHGSDVEQNMLCFIKMTDCKEKAQQAVKHFFIHQLMNLSPRELRSHSGKVMKIKDTEPEQHTQTHTVRPANIDCYGEGKLIISLNPWLSRLNTASTVFQHSDMS